jgi:hypothetical protein
MKNKTPKVFIRITNFEDKKAATFLLMKLSGLKIHPTFKDLDDFCKMWDCYPVISNVDAEIDGHAYKPSRYNHITQFEYPSQASEIVEHFARTKKSYMMDLNDDYSVEVIDGVIKVGCQTISFEKLNELNELVAEYHKDKN